MVPLVPEELPTRQPRAWLRWARQPAVLGAAVITLFAVTTGLYYAVFFCLIGGVVALLISAKTRSLRAGVTLLTFVGLGGAVLVAQYVPVVLNQRRNGNNLGAIGRRLYDVEFYSLKLSDMLLPVQGHRIHAFAKWQADAQAVPLTGERAEALGLIGTLGLLALFAIVIVRAFTRAPRGSGRAARGDGGDRVPLLAPPVGLAVGWASSDSHRSARGAASQF